MDCYAALGVDEKASVHEIRKAYVRLAREFHPDLRGSDPAAAARMREINDAWAVLSDGEARASYDRSRERHGSGRAPGSSRPRHARGVWEPFDPGPVEGFDEDDDRPLSTGGLPNWLRIAPPIAFVGGILAVVLGGFVGILPVVAAGLTSILLSFVLFLVAPLVALTSSKRGSKP